MRTLLRTALITALLAFIAFLSWFLMSFANSPKSTQVAAGSSVPSYCVPEVLVGLEEQLAKPNDANTTRLLLIKKQDALNGEATCVANATLYPPAPKPTNLVGVLLPTPIPSPTPTFQLGIQDAILVAVPGMNFVPIGNQNNYWAGLVDGKAIIIATGSLIDPTTDQGAVDVVVNDEWGKATNYPTPSLHGSVHIVAACGSTLVLQSMDNTLFTFDVTTMTYVSNPGSCPTPTP